MRVHIEIDTKTFIRFWLVLIGFALVALAIYSARTALIILGVALFLALALNGPVSRLAKYMPGKSRVVSTAIAYIIVVMALGAFIFLAIPAIAQQTGKFVQSVPALVETARTQGNGLNHLVEQYNLQPQLDAAIKAINENASQTASSFGKNIISGLGSVFSALTAVFLVLVLSFLMLIEGPNWTKRIWLLYSDKEKMKYHRTIAQRMNAVVSGYVTGQLTVSAIGAAFAGLTVFVLSLIFPVPSNLAIPTAAITFVFSLIPMFGATIGGLIVAALLAFNTVGAAVVYLIYFVIYQQIENNYISPTIQSKRNDLSPLAILASVTIGLYLFGIAGGIISIPIAGCVKILFEAYIEHTTYEREKEKKKTTSDEKNKLIA